MPAPVPGPLGTLLATVSKAAEEAAEENVDHTMAEPGRTIAVASTHIAMMVALLREEDTRRGGLVLPGRRGGPGRRPPGRHRGPGRRMRGRHALRTRRWPRRASVAVSCLLAALLGLVAWSPHVW